MKINDSVYISKVLDLRKKNKKRKEYPICICIYHHDSKTRKYVRTGYSCSQAKFASLFSNRIAEERKAVANKINVMYDSFVNAAHRLIDKNAFSVNNLLKAVEYAGSLQKASAYVYLTDAIQDMIDEKRNSEKYNTAMTYVNIYSSIEKYRPACKILDFDLADFIGFLQECGNNTTTVAIKLRTLKSVFSRLEKMNAISPALNPFNNYTIKEGKSRNLFLKDEDLQGIKEFATNGNLTKEQLRYVRFWLLSYYMCGANINDILRLKRCNIDLYNQEIVYMRHKTGKRIIVPISDPILKLFDMLTSLEILEKNDYVFPYIRDCADEEAIIKKVKTFVKSINTAMALYKPGITTYTARHTYSGKMLRMGASTELIKESLGHSSILTTEIYLSGFETSQIAKYTNRL